MRELDNYHVFFGYGEIIIFIIYKWAIYNYQILP